MDQFVSQKQKRDMRVPFNHVVRFGVDRSNLHMDKAHDISKSGMFIETDKPFKVGSNVHLNFDLISDYQVKNIKAVGKVVRLTGSAKKAAKRESAGVGIKFSLLPSEEFLIRSFVEDMANQTAKFSPAFNQKAKHVCVEVKHSPDSLFCLTKWWLKEMVDKAFAYNGLIMQLVLLVIFVTIAIMVFL